jgi:uncharacterized protein (TIGR03435 family)
VGGSVAQRAFRTGSGISAFLAILILMSGQRLPAQASAAPSATTPVDVATEFAAFDVTSIKPFDPKAKMSMLGFRYTADGVQAQSISVPMMIRAAYGGFAKLPTDDAVIGVPDWAKNSLYAVEGKMNTVQVADFAKLTANQQELARQRMLQALLLERFKLQVHPQSKSMPDFDLIVVRTGPRLHQGDTNPEGVKGPDGKPLPGSYLRMFGMGKIAAQGFTMEAFAHFLMQPQNGLGRPVVDKTGLTGKYNFTMEWTPDPAFTPRAAPGPVGGLPPDPSGPSIYTALEEQLGLRLKPSTGTFDLVVIDHVEPPQQD